MEKRVHESAVLYRVQPKRMSFEDYVTHDDDDLASEWVDGEVIPLTTNIRHADVTGFLYGLIWLFVRSKRVGRVYQESVLMKNTMRPSGRKPDLMFVAKENLHRFRKAYLDGPADLAVEVVSIDSEVRDPFEKRDEYESFGVRECWVINPLNETAQFYSLQSNGEYIQMDPDSEGYIHSVVLPGFRLKIAWLWEDPHREDADVYEESAGLKVVRIKE